MVDLKAEDRLGGNVLAAAANGVEQFISQLGGDAARVLSRSGIPERRLEDPTLPLDLQSYIAMMELAAVETRNDNFGLWFGYQFEPARLGLIGHIAMASPTLGAAIENLASYFRFHQHRTETRIVRDGALLRLEYRVTDSRVVHRRQDAELTMGMFANVFRHCLGPDWAPEEVYFEHLQPEAAGEHERAFDAPVHFGRGTNALVFNDRELANPMPRRNLSQLTALQNEIVRIAGESGPRSFIDVVKSEIRCALPDGYPHIASIADTMEIRRWTLQRRLADHGYTFSLLVENVRRELAALYVRQQHLPIVDIAFALGYSELSAFSRAFSRWFEISPQSLRRLHTQQLPERGYSGLLWVDDNQ